MKDEISALKFIKDNERLISLLGKGETPKGLCFIGENTMKSIELHLPHYSYLRKHSSSMISDNYPFRNSLFKRFCIYLKHIFKLTVHYT